MRNRGFGRLITGLLCASLVGTALASTAIKNAPTAWTEPTKGTANMAPNVAMVEHSTGSIIQEGTFATTVIISEVLAKPTLETKDPITGDMQVREQVELYNYGTAAVSLEGWHLEDASGTKVTLTGVIPPKGYHVVRLHNVLNNNGDELKLITGEKEIDRFTYTEDQVEADMSLSKFCELIELGWCEIEQGQQTFGNSNATLELKVLPEVAPGVVEKGSTVNFQTNIKGATLWYTTSPDGAMLDDMKKLEGPLPVPSMVTYYVMATKGNLSSKVERYQYVVRGQRPVIFRQGVYINEVHPTEGWIELKNITVDPVSSVGWRLAPTPFAYECSPATCVNLSELSPVRPWRKYVLPIENMIEEDETTHLYVLDNEGRVVDEIHVPALSKEEALDYVSFARVHYGTKRLASFRNTRHGLEQAMFMWTRIATPREENLILKKVQSGPDYDLLSVEDEANLGTDTKLFDSNYNGIPDYMDHGKDAVTPEQERIQKFLYHKLLTVMFTMDLHVEQGLGVITGVTVPHATVRLYVGTTEVASTLSNEYGNFAVVYPEFEGRLPTVLSARIEDLRGVSSFDTAVQTFDVTGLDQNKLIRQGDLQFDAALPNPEGADAFEEERLRLKNLSDSAKSLDGVRLVLNGTEYGLPSFTIEGGATFEFDMSELGKHLPNAQGTLVLRSAHSGVIYDEVSYEDAPEGEYVTFHLPEPVSEPEPEEGDTDEDSVIIEDTRSEEISYAAPMEVASFEDSSTAPVLSSSETVTIAEEKTHTSTAEAIWAFLLGSGGLLSGVGYFKL